MQKEIHFLAHCFDERLSALNCMHASLVLFVLLIIQVLLLLLREAQYFLACPKELHPYLQYAEAQVCAETTS